MVLFSSMRRLFIEPKTCVNPLFSKSIRQSVISRQILTISTSVKFYFCYILRWISSSRVSLQSSNMRQTFLRLEQIDWSPVCQNRFKLIRFLWVRDWRKASLSRFWSLSPMNYLRANIWEQSVLLWITVTSPYASQVYLRTSLKESRGQIVSIFEFDSVIPILLLILPLFVINKQQMKKYKSIPH